MDEVKDFLERLRKEMFVRHVEEIAPIISRGGVAVVVFEPSQAAKAALQFGFDWTGEPVFRLSNAARKRLVHSKAAARWLDSTKRGRILVFSGNGSLCVNFSPEVGYTIEPGTTDEIWKQGLH